jgi:exosortase
MTPALERAHQASPGVLARYSKLALGTALMAVLYVPVMAGLAKDWWNEEGLSYGLLVAPLALWTAWEGRRRTFAIAARADSRGLLLVGVACLLHAVGTLAVEFFLPRISFALMLAGVAWTQWGLDRLRSLAFPLMLLAAMTPLPGLLYGSISLPLQLAASGAGAWVARQFGVVVLREGNVLHLAGISLGVEEACSGLNSLAALMVTAIVLAFLICRRPLARGVLFLCWAPIAIGVNILRISATAVLADWNRDLAAGFYHLFSGWLVYLAAFLLLFGCAVTLNRLSLRS